MKKWLICLWVLAAGSLLAGGADVPALPAELAAKVAAGWTAEKSGDQHWLVSEPGGGKTLAYHEVTGRVFDAPDAAALAARRARALHPLNTGVIAVFFLGMAAMGFFFMRRNRTTDDYFRGGGRLPWWAVSLSIYSTMFSSITFLSIPALSYRTDCRYAVITVGILALAPVVARWYLPFFRRLNLTSAYEFLEKRFNLACRLFASTAFVLFMVARTAVVAYLPAVAIAAVVDIEINTAIVIVTVVTILYCALGGIEAVIWSECVQSLILIGSVFLVAGWLVCGTDGGAAGWWETAHAAGKLRVFDFALDWTQPTFWVVLVGGVVANLASYTSDQCVVQRYMTTKDERAAAKSILTNGVISFFNSLLFFVIGTGLFTYFRSHPEELGVCVPRNDSVFPLFIVNALPPGVSGLILAALAAATMSTLSTNLNSAATAVTTDFYARLVPGVTERGKMRCARVCTVATGVLGGAAALMLANMEVQSIYDQFQRFLGVLTGGLGCLFLMGIFMPRVSGRGAMAGLAVNYAVCFALDAVDFAGKPHLLLYGFLGMAACLATATVLSMFESPTKKASGK